MVRRYSVLLGLVVALCLPAGAACTTTPPPAWPLTLIRQHLQLMATPQPMTFPGRPGRMVRSPLTVAGVLQPAASAYPLRNLNSGLCLEVYHSSTSDGGKVDQWTCNGTNTQYWIPYIIGTSGAYNAIELVNANSGLCAEVQQSSTSKGAHVDQWTCNGTNTQYWIDNTNHYAAYNEFINVNSGLVLEVYHSSTSKGATVDQWTYNGTPTQLWY